MNNEKRYTWTISVIAIYNDDEEALKEAYIEFEESIKDIANPNKDIQFVIFFYDSNKETAVIKKSIIKNERIVLLESEAKKVDLYEETFAELKSFFKNHVAKDQIEYNEEHKHFLITWGHGAGLGFMRTEIEEKLKHIYRSTEAFRNHNIVEKKENINRIDRAAHRMYKLNTIATYIGLDRNSEDFRKTYRTNFNFLLPPDTLFNNKEMEKEAMKSFRSIDPHELAAIISDGLKNDKSVVTSVQNANSELSTDAKIQVMLCLTCYVNMIETGFALKDLVNVFIAPQTEIPFYGYNYKKLFELLNVNLGANERQIAENITHFYLPKYLEHRIQTRVIRGVIYEINYEKGVAFSAVYLKLYEKLAEKIGLFTDLISAELQKTSLVKTNLANARFRCNSMKKIGIGDLGIIDYENFLTEFLQLYKLSRNDSRRFYDYTHIISEYCPGFLCRSYYSDIYEDFFSLSPGSYSIFLPNLNFSPEEKELIKLYKKMNGKNQVFQNISGWYKIIDILNPI